MRLERISNVKILLLADDHINYVQLPNLTPVPVYFAQDGVRFAYFDKDEVDVNVLIDAIKHDKSVNILIERRQKGKEFDYLMEVSLTKKEKIPKEVREAPCPSGPEPPTQ